MLIGCNDITNRMEMTINRNRQGQPIQEHLIYTLDSTTMTFEANISTDKYGLKDQYSVAEVMGTINLVLENADNPAVIGAVKSTGGIILPGIIENPAMQALVQPVNQEL